MSRLEQGLELVRCGVERNFPREVCANLAAFRQYQTANGNWEHFESLEENAVLEAGYLQLRGPSQFVLYARGRKDVDLGMMRVDGARLRRINLPHPLAPESPRGPMRPLHTFVHPRMAWMIAEDKQWINFPPLDSEKIEASFRNGDLPESFCFR